MQPFMHLPQVQHIICPSWKQTQSSAAGQGSFSVEVSSATGGDAIGIAAGRGGVERSSGLFSAGADGGVICLSGRREYPAIKEEGG